MSIEGHHLNKLGTRVPDVVYQVSVISAIRFRIRYFKGFYHIWTRRPTWLCLLNCFNKFGPPCLMNLTRFCPVASGQKLFESNEV